MKKRKGSINSFFGMIDYAIDEMLRAVWHPTIFYWPIRNRFEHKWKQGVSYYTKPKKNPCSIQHKKPNYDRRVMSKRIFTHTKK